MLNPLLTLSEAEDSLKELSEFVLANGGNFTLQTVPSWMSFFSAHPGLDVCPVIRNSFLPSLTICSIDNRSPECSWFTTYIQRSLRVRNRPIRARKSYGDFTEP